MSALFQRARRGPGPLILLMLVLDAGSLLAHDPGLSALEVCVRGNEVAAKFLEFFGDLDDAPGAHVQAHAFKSVSVESEFLRVLQRIVDLFDARRGALEKQADEFAEHADAVFRRHFAQFSDNVHIDQLIGG